MWWRQNDKYTSELSEVIWNCWWLIQKSKVSDSTKEKYMYNIKIIVVYDT